MLCWWTIALCLPTLLLAAPVWMGLQARFDHTIHAGAIATGQDIPLLVEGLRGAAEFATGGLKVNAIAAVAMTLLLSPWLTGMVVASIRSQRRLRMDELLQGGFSEYGRMFRTLLWSIFPLALAIGLGLLTLKAGKKHTEMAILASEVEHARYVGLSVLGVLFLVAHMTLEAGRGWLGADRNLRSVMRAWWRGTKLVFRRPLASLTVYLGATLAGLVLVALVGLWRINVSGATIGGFAGGLLLTQLAIVILNWSRIARLHGYAVLATDSINAKSITADERANEASIA